MKEREEGTKKELIGSPTKAIALKYKETDPLPLVSASGQGEIAKRIIALAKKHDIPLYRDEVLAELLSELPSNSVISPETYKLVAEIICFLYYLDEKWRDEHPHVGNLIGHVPNESEQSAD